MNKKYVVDLQAEERQVLERTIHSGKHSAVPRAKFMH
jgi:hypothetical protein